MLSLQHHGGKIIRFEDLQIRPQETLEDIFHFVGLNPCADAMQKAERMVHRKHVSDVLKKIPPEEQWKVLHLVEKISSKFDYDSKFFQKNSASFDFKNLNSNYFPVGFWPIRGFNESGARGYRLQRHGEGIIYTNKNTKQLLIKIWSNFPNDLASDSLIKLDIIQDGHVLLHHSATAGAQRAIIPIKLREENR